MLQQKEINLIKTCSDLIKGKTRQEVIKNDQKLSLMITKRQFKRTQSEMLESPFFG